MRSSSCSSSSRLAGTSATTSSNMPRVYELSFVRSRGWQGIYIRQACRPGLPVPPCRTLHRLFPRSAKILQVELPNRYNVGADLIERNLPQRSAKIAIHSATADLTYSDLFQLVNGAARRLLDLGVRREERVLIAGYDSPGWVAAFLGAIRIGSVPVPVNPLLQRSEDYDHYIDDSLARVIVVDGNTEEKLAPAAGRARTKPP